MRIWGRRSRSDEGRTNTSHTDRYLLAAEGGRAEIESCIESARVEGNPPHAEYRGFDKGRHVYEVLGQDAADAISANLRMHGLGRVGYEIVR